MGRTVRTAVFKDMIGQSGDGARFFAYFFFHHGRLASLVKTSFILRIFFVTLRQMVIKGIYISEAPPLIGQERSRNMPPPLQNKKNRLIG